MSTIARRQSPPIGGDVSPEAALRSLVKTATGAVASVLFAAPIGALLVPVLKRGYHVNLDQAVAATAVLFGIGFVCARLIVAALRRSFEEPRTPHATNPVEASRSVIVAACLIVAAMFIAYITVVCAFSAWAFMQVPQLLWARDAAIQWVQWFALGALAVFGAAVLGVIANALRRRLLRLGSDLHAAFADLGALVTFELERSVHRSKLSH